MATKAVSIQLDDKTLERLAYITAATGRHSDALISEAIKQYVVQETENGAVTEAIAAADRRELVEHAKVKVKWVAKQRSID
mgnify:FL=1